MTSNQLMKRIKMEDDNSCLFKSFDYCMSFGTANSTKDDIMNKRRAIASEIQSNPTKYTEAFLGLNPQKYCEKITHPNTWGGGIELDILSTIFHVQICVLDIRAGRSYVFGENMSDASRIYLIYDGCHYDAVARQSESDGVTTFFSPDDINALREAEELMLDEKQKGNYTDITKFTLKCDICETLLTGQQQASQHAKEFGHVDFSEIKKS